jgi:hypothetical protein
MPIFPSVTYNLIPNLRTRPNPTPDSLKHRERTAVKAMLAAGLIKSSAFDGDVVANDLGWLLDYGMKAKLESNGRAKTWIFDRAFEAIQVGHNGDGTWATDANTHDSIEGFQNIPRDVSDFYKKFRTYFHAVPRFVLQQYSEEEAGRLQFGDGPAVDFPLGKMLRNDPLVNFKPAMPQGIAYEIMSDGELYWFKIAEWIAAIPAAPSQPQPGAPAQPPLSDMLVLSSVSQILGGSDSMAEKVQQLKAVIARAR